MIKVTDKEAPISVQGDLGNKVVARVGGGSAMQRSRKPAGAITPAHAVPLDNPQQSWVATAQYAQALVQTRRRRSRRMLAWFFILVMGPTLATAAYFAFFATPRYTSEFEFTFQTYRGPANLASGLVQSVTGTSQQNTVDLGSIVYEYLRSPALFEKLDKSLDLRGRFSQPVIDWLSRLAPNSTQANLNDYLRSHVSVSLGLGGYLDVKVSTYDRDFSATLAKAIVSASDAMVDELTSRARNNQVSFAEAELARQEDRVRKARLAMTTFQNEHGDQDPTRAASQLGSIVGAIEGDLATAKTQLASVEPSMNPGSPIVVQLKQKIASLQDQLKQQQARLATDKSGGKTPYSKILEDYSRLQVEEEFAKNAYLAAQQGLVVARVDAAGKQNYLVDFAPPNTPDRMDFSFPIGVTASVLLVALLIFGFGSITVGAARDQIAG